MQKCNLRPGRLKSKEQGETKTMRCKLRPGTEKTKKNSSKGRAN